MPLSVVRLATFACIAGVGGAAALACARSDRGLPSPGTANERIVIAPESIAVVVGATTTLSAVAQDGSGSRLNGVTFFWSSSDTSIAAVDQSGTVSSRLVGRVQIAASAQGASGVATVIVEAAPIGAVIVAPAVASIHVNSTLQLTDTAKDAQGNVLRGQAVAWLTDNAAVATVDTNGLLIARGVGVAHISAAVDGKIGVATITVTAVPVASVTITPPSASLDVRQTTQLSATPLDSAGNPLLNRTVTWHSATPSAATVSGSGLVMGVAPGTSVIQATSETRVGAATVTVHPPPVSAVVVSPATSSVFIGQSEKLTAQVTDASGFPVAGAIVTFSSANAAVATVGASTGVVTGIGVGATTITGTSGGKSGKATVTVLQVPVASVVISPPTETLIIGSQATLHAAALDSSGHPLLGRATTWTSGAPAIATVSSAGVVHAVAAGTTVITARVGGVAGQSSVIVQEVPVGSVTVTPDTATLQQGQQLTLKVTVRDRTGALVIDRPAAWTSTNVSVATVSSVGQVNALNVGIASIVATAQGVADTATITVVPAAVGSVTVTPNPATVQVQSTVALTATVRDVGGAVLTGRPVQWVSGSPAIATVDATTGVVTGVAAGVATISATSGGVTGTTTVQVGAVPISKVAIAPTDTTITSAQTAQLRVTITNSLGQVVSTPAATWSSAPSGRVSSSGLVTPQPADAGTTITVTAAAGGQSGSAAVHVTTPPPAPVASVTVAPNPATVEVQASAALTATLRDGSGNVLTGRVVQWTSGSPAIATVNSASGVVTGVAAGTATVSATSGGVTGTASVQVTAAPISSVTVAPSDTTITSAQTAQLRATVMNSLGQVVSTAPTWSSAPSGRVSSTGRVTPQAADAGSTITVTATAGGKSGTAAVHVTSPPPPPVASVTVAPNPASVQVQSTVALTATLRDGSGNVLTGRVVQWTSGSPAIATVNSASGVVTGVAAGTATVSATSGGVTGTASVQVTAAPISSVTVAPSDTTITSAQTAQLRATVMNSLGQVVSTAPTWSSAPSGRVSSTGRVTPQAADAGSTITVTATAGGKSGTAAVHVTSPPPPPVASVTVTPNPASVQVQSTVALTATLRDGSGNVLTGRVVQWTSGSPAIATVNSASGVVTGVAAGTATVSATSEGVTGTASVQVTAAPISSVTVAPSDTTITSAQTAQLSATVTNSLGQVVSTPTPTWSSAPSGRVSSTGLVTPQTADGGNTITVTATAGGKSGTAAVHVTVPFVPVATVVVAPQLDTIYATAPGNGVALTDTTKSSTGTILTGRTVTWSSSSGVASVGSTGQVTGTGTAAGSATITATSADGPSGSATVVVIGHVATVTVTPNPLALSTTGTGLPTTGNLTAALTDTFGTDVSGQRTVTWSSADNTIATVSNTGLVTAVSATANSVLITATTSDGQTGTATVNVSP